MQGRVVEINEMVGMLAVLTDDGAYSIIELLGGSVEVGHRLQWEGDYPLGGATIKNLATGSRISVYFQNHDVPEAQLRQQLLY